MSSGGLFLCWDLYGKSPCSNSWSLRISDLVLSYARPASLKEVFYFYFQLQLLFFIFLFWWQNNYDSHLSIFLQIRLGVLGSPAVHSCQLWGPVLSVAVCLNEGAQILALCNRKRISHIRDVFISPFLNM